MSLLDDLVGTIPTKQTVRRCRPFAHAVTLAAITARRASQSKPDRSFMTSVKHRRVHLARISPGQRRAVQLEGVEVDAFAAVKDASANFTTDADLRNLVFAPNPGFADRSDAAVWL